MKGAGVKFLSLFCVAFVLFIVLDDPSGAAASSERFSRFAVEMLGAFTDVLSDVGNSVGQPEAAVVR